MKRWLTIACLISALGSQAQNEEIDLEEFAERLFQIQDQDIEYEDIYESLLLFYSNKLNLNKVQPEELASIYILSPAQLADFFNYRDKFGDFLSIHELQAIPTFDLTIIQLIIPFVTVEESALDTRPFLRRVLEEENNYFLLRFSRRLEEQKGYTEAFPLDTTFVVDENEDIIDTVATPPSRYKGSPNKVYGRFRTSRRGDFSLGFTFEKDNGEEFAFNRKQKGFDFYSYHLLLENKLGFDKIMLGDYQLQVGQGIVFGAGFNAGKGAETVNTLKRNTTGLRPYTSVLEGGFFRGGGLSKTVGNFEVTGFFSKRKIDGSIQVENVESDENTVLEEFTSSISTSGFHRTSSEINRKNAIDEINYGGLIRYRPHRRLNVGISGLATNYSVELRRTPNNYNQFEFQGNRNHIVSAFGHYTWQNFTFFGEAARSKSGGIGAIGGLVSSLSRTVDMAVIFRNYDRDFHSFYGNAFSENSRNINENGVYWGLSITPDRKHKVNLYYDRFQFPWLKFGTETPSIGNEWLARYTHNPNRKVSLYVQVRQQTRQVSTPLENLNLLTDQIKYNYIFNIDYKLTSGLSLKTKVQSSTQKEGEVRTEGFAILQDVNFEIWKLKFHTRVALFETDDFDNAQYVYENDVLYAFSIPAYNGQGMRTYAMVRYDPFRNISFWIRYAQFNFRDRDTVGSGLEESKGATSSEVKMMIRVRF